MSPATLSDAAEVPNGRITIHCDRCGRERTYPPAAILARAGDMTLIELRRRAKCDPGDGGCFAKYGRVIFWVDVWAGAGAATLAAGS
jgi:hypothetical protein